MQSYISAMVTRIGKAGCQHLYVTEHLRAKGLSDGQVANRVGVARETIWKWRSSPHLLEEERLSALATAIGLDSYLDFYRPPGEESLDAMLVGQPAELRETARDIVRRLVRRG